MSARTRPIVEARSLHVSAGACELLHGVNLTVHAGERIALVGRNGAGKSTLIRTFCGLAHVARGGLVVHDTDLSGQVTRESMRQMRRKVAQVHQGLHLVGRLSALDNVLIGGAGRHTSSLTWLRVWPSREQERARAALTRVGMEWSTNRRVDSLSGGERQKVAIARALHQDAPLLLADEPTASLDASAAVQMATLLAEAAAERHAALVTVVHDLHLVPHLATRVVALRRGSVVADWPVTDETVGRLRGLLQ